MQFREKLGSGQQSFLELWHTLGKAGSLPLKADFSPKNLRGLSSHFAIFCRNDKGDLIVAFSGTRLDDVWGRNITGGTVQDATVVGRRKLVLAFFNKIMAQPCGGHVAETYTKETGVELSVNTLYLPIDIGDGSVGIISIWEILDPGSKWQLHLPKRSDIDRRRFHYADFIDVGFGVPAEQEL